MEITSKIPLPSVMCFPYRRRAHPGRQRIPAAKKIAVATIKITSNIGAIPLESSEVRRPSCREGRKEVIRRRSEFHRRGPEGLPHKLIESAVLLLYPQNQCIIPGMAP